ncbi:MAG: hypothetical protein M0R03_17320 [Novosphingobium sp.]|jgi:hypothetical protein|nr:hypothetical protein [Novosphingobium sp.]
MSSLSEKVIEALSVYSIDDYFTSNDIANDICKYFSGDKPQPKDVSSALCKLRDKGFIIKSDALFKRQNKLSLSKTYWIKIKEYDASQAKKLPRSHPILSSALEICKSVKRLEERKDQEIKKLKEANSGLISEIQGLTIQVADLQETNTKLHEIINREREQQYDH